MPRSQASLPGGGAGLHRGVARLHCCVAGSLGRAAGCLLHPALLAPLAHHMPCYTACKLRRELNVSAGSRQAEIAAAAEYQVNHTRHQQQSREPTCCLWCWPLLCRRWDMDAAAQYQVNHTRHQQQSREPTCCLWCWPLLCRRWDMDAAAPAALLAAVDMSDPPCSSN